MLHRAFNWAFLLLSLVLLFRLGGAWHNTLIKNHAWVSEKQAAGSFPGADEFMSSPSTLRGETLRLGTWLGHQHIHTRNFIQTPAAGEIRFDSRIGRNSYLVVSLYDENGNQPVAIRLSRNLLFPSAFLKIQRDEFVEKKLLNGVNLSPAYHSFSLRWSPEKTELQIDQEHFPLNFTLPPKFQLGFAGGLDTADGLKNIRVHQAGKQRSIFHEYFLPQYGRPLAAALFCLFLGLVAGTGFLSLKNRFIANLVVLMILFASVFVNERFLLPRAAKFLQAREAGPATIYGTKTELTALLSNSNEGAQIPSSLESIFREQFKREWHVVTEMPNGMSPALLILGMDFRGESRCVDRLSWAKKTYPTSKFLFLEIPHEGFFDKQQVAKEEDCISFANHEKISFLSARKVLEEKADTGFLWWDNTHLTKRGLDLFQSAIKSSLPKHATY